MHTSAPPREEPILPLRGSPALVEPVRQVKGALLSTSLRWVRESPYADEYWRALGEHEEALRQLIVTTWLPVEVAMAHYGALDGLPVAHGEQRRVGQLAADRIQGSWAATVIRGLKATGAVDPARVLGRFDQGWKRLMMGGQGAVYRIGPKDLRVECHGLPMMRFGFFRSLMAGMQEGTLGMVARKVYVREIASSRTPTRCDYHIAWV